MVAFSGLRLPAGNKQSLPIQGWVNIKDNTQTRIKRRSLWHWSGFETIEEKATVGELSDKLGKNKVAKLDLDDYTPAMRALHQILTGTLIYSTQRKKDLPPPTFTDSNLKEGLRRSWTAEQIGHLLVRYESEWYADAALSKWNEIDELFEEEKRQQKALIEEGLDNLGITRPYQRDFAMEKVDEAHEHVKSNWQREKEQRIKPSLWWQQVAQAQAQVQNQTTSTEQSDADTNSPKLTNLSTDGKAWFIHPVAMVGYFAGIAERAAIVTYHIYHNGKIEKHIPQEILEGYEQKYKYVYHDKEDNKHEICIVDWHTTNKKRLVKYPRGIFQYPDHGRVLEAKTNISEGYISARAKYVNGDFHEWIKKEHGVSLYERLTMVNGDIAEYGKHDTDGMTWRLYTKQEEKVQLIRMPDRIDYFHNDVIINYELQETYRKYTNPDVMAGFIGALAEIKENIIVTGSAYEQGSCFPSALHINGQSIDTKYIKKVRNLSDWEKDKEFVMALAKFHFKTFRIGRSIFEKYFQKIEGTVNGGILHNSHLHTENFDLESIKKIP